MTKSKKTQDADVGKILEDWLTFTFTNVRVGTTNDWSEREYILNCSELDRWKSRMYCLSCGALWNMETKGYECPECKDESMRMLVCRRRSVPIVKKIPIVWYQPSTWSGVVNDVEYTWEYRLKESDARTGVTY